MLGVITTIARGALKALLATTKNKTTGKTIKKVFKDPKAAEKWLRDKGATEIKMGSPKGVSARGGQTRESQFPESLLRKKQGGSQVGPVPDPKRKPKIIISGPGKKITEQEMKNDLSRWGVGDEVILELRGQALRTAYAAMKKKVESRKGGGKVLYKAEGSKLINKKKKKKKQGYKARKDESIAQRVKKKRTKKQLKASRDESYGKWGKGKGKGKIRRITSKQTDGNKLVASLYD